MCCVRGGQMLSKDLCHHYASRMFAKERLLCPRWHSPLPAYTAFPLPSQTRLHPAPPSVLDAGWGVSVCACDVPPYSPSLVTCPNAWDTAEALANPLNTEKASIPGISMWKTSCHPETEALHGLSHVSEQCDLWCRHCKFGICPTTCGSHSLKYLVCDS